MEGDEDEVPHAPYTPEDDVYQIIVSEYAGLRRAGADPLDAALITAAHLVVMATVNAELAARQAGD